MTVPSGVSGMIEHKFDRRFNGSVYRAGVGVISRTVSVRSFVGVERL